MTVKSVIWLIAISVIVGGILGFQIKGWVSPPPKIEYKTETIYVPQDREVTIFKTRTVPGKVIPITVNVPTPDGDVAFIDWDYDPVIKDSVSEMQDSILVESVFTQIAKGDSLQRNHSVKAKDLKKEKIVFETKEVLKEVNIPFYKDGWFWTAAATLVLLVLSIL